MAHDPLTGKKVFFVRTIILICLAISLASIYCFVRG